MQKLFSFPSGNTAQFGRNSQSDHKIVTGQKALFLAMQPKTCFMVLTIRTKAIAAGVENELGTLAFSTAVNGA